MPRRRFLRILIVASLFLVLALTAELAPAVGADCPGNPVRNPGFEDGFRTRGASQVVVAKEWEPWYQDGPNQEDGYYHRPDYGAENASVFGRRRVREGNFAQKWSSTYATHRAGILQQIAVPANSMVTLKAWAQAWSSSADNPAVSKEGAYALMVGIDPTGGVDWRASTVIWSPANTALDSWVELSVQARAKGDRVTVYLRGEATYRLKHNDAYFDDVCVSASAPPTPIPLTRAPTRVPTQTPIPTDTPPPTETSTPASTETPTPSPTPSATPTPKQGSIRVFVFEDRNGSGIRDEQEDPLAGVRIMVANAQRTPVAEHVSDGNAEGYTFSELPPGDYIVTEENPPGYTSTSPIQWAGTLIEGGQLEVTFANQFQPTATPTLAPKPTTVPPIPAPTPQPAKGLRSVGTWLYSISGLLAALLALAAPLAIRYTRTRR